jgi:hypothetical protein
MLDKMENDLWTTNYEISLNGKVPPQFFFFLREFFHPGAAFLIFLYFQ